MEDVMARMPGKPVDEQGNPIFPHATSGEDDEVQGHIALAFPPVEDEEDDPEVEA